MNDLQSAVLVEILEGLFAVILEDKITDLVKGAWLMGCYPVNRHLNQLKLVVCANYHG